MFHISTKYIQWVWGLIVVAMFLVVVSSCNQLISRKEQYNHPLEKAPMNLDEVKSLALEGNEYLWIGNHSGVAQINAKSGKSKLFDDISCPRIFVTSSNIWCSVVNYINKYDGEAWKRFDIQAYNIIETRSGQVLAGTMDGLTRFDQISNNWEYIFKVDANSSKFVFTTGPGVHLSFQASDESIWFYSYSEAYLGVTRWTTDTYTTWQPLGDQVMVKPILEASDNSIWGIGDDGSVLQWDGDKWQIWYPFHLKLAVIDLLETEDGSIWALAVVDGIGRWNGKRWQIWSKNKVILDRCPKLYEEQQCFDEKANVIYLSPEGLGKPDNTSPRFALSTMVRSDRRVWVGTGEEGISRWNGKVWNNYTIRDGLSSNRISVLVTSSDGMLWAGTSDSGINYYNPETDQWIPLPFE